METYDYAYYKKSADYLKSVTNGFEPEVGLILGSGLGPLAKEVENPIVVDYKDIPNFLVTTNKAHAGKMIFGTLGNKRVVCMQGRFHSYEGYSMRQLSIPVRVLKLLGIKTIILTNAAGAVNLSYKPGDIMIFNDHLKLTMESPMVGANVDEFGPRFFDISKTYTPSLRTLAEECLKKEGLRVHEGVYMFFTGPQFETPAEIRAARVLGADAVGMSTINESLTAAHCGLPCLAMSVITNMAAGILDAPLTDEEVCAVADTISTSFTKGVKEIVSKL